MLDLKELKEQILEHLLDIRNTLLLFECQEIIYLMPQERQRELCQLVSMAQTSYARLQRASTEQLSDRMERVEKALLEGMRAMRESMTELTKLETFITEATKFTARVQDVSGNASLSI
jgi:hypothetical protein